MLAGHPFESPLSPWIESPLSPWIPMDSPWIESPPFPMDFPWIESPPSPWISPFPPSPWIPCGKLSSWAALRPRATLHPWTALPMRLPLIYGTAFDPWVAAAHAWADCFLEAAARAPAAQSLTSSQTNESGGQAHADWNFTSRCGPEQDQLTGAGAGLA